MGFLEPETLVSRKWGFGPLSGVGGIPMFVAVAVVFVVFVISVVFVKGHPHASHRFGKYTGLEMPELFWPSLSPQVFPLKQAHREIRIHKQVEIRGKLPK